jgi:hypothetical protein
MDCESPASSLTCAPETLIHNLGIRHIHPAAHLLPHRQSTLNTRHTIKIQPATKSSLPGTLLSRLLPTPITWQLQFSSSIWLRVVPSFAGLLPNRLPTSPRPVKPPPPLPASGSCSKATAKLQQSYSKAPVKVDSSKASASPPVGDFSPYRGRTPVLRTSCLGGLVPLPAQPAPTPSQERRSTNQANRCNTGPAASPRFARLHITRSQVRASCLVPCASRSHITVSALR